MYKVTIYDNKRIIDLTLAEPGILNWNLPMNESFFKIFKGTQNVIEFVIRNNDRKPVNLIGKTVMITIIDRKSFEALVEKPLKIIDAYAGSVVLHLTGFEVSTWPVGYLAFRVTIQDGNDGFQRMLYINQNEGGYGDFELIDGPTMIPSPNYICTTFVSSYWGWPVQPYWFSSILPGSARRTNAFGLQQTGVIYSRNFSGKIWVLGSLENDSPDKDADVWFKIPLKDPNQAIPAGVTVDADYYNYLQLSQYTGTTVVSFETSVQWIRFMFAPDLGLPGCNTAPPYGIVGNNGEIIFDCAGIIDKIVFRN